MSRPTPEPGCSAPGTDPAAGLEAVFAALRAMDLLAPGEIPIAEPLAGGVSSDIWKVTRARGPLCVKRARARLRVDAIWEAPVERNASEVAWLEMAARVEPGAAPRLLGHAPEAGLFAMEWLDPAIHPIWKARLFAGEIRAADAAALGARVGRIHAASAREPDLREHFDHGDLFEALRLEPYIRSAARVHPDRAARLLDCIFVWESHAAVVVHGDVSPKNVLLGPCGPVLLDAECACWGDPAFDVAFCATHLLLKAISVPGARAAALRALDAWFDSYAACVDWEPGGALLERAAHWLPALLLARVDGKSPVEYLDERAQGRVRKAARDWLAREGTVAGLDAGSRRFAEEAAP